MTEAPGNPATRPRPRFGGVRPALATAALLAAWLGVVQSLLVPLALTRQVHIDESQVAFNAALLGWHGLPELMNFRAPFVVPLSWIAARGGEAWPRLLEMRVVFLVLFLLNLALVALVSPRLRGAAARAAALLAITLVEPFWRHGFEIRHDVLQLALSLGLYGLALRTAAGRGGGREFAAAGLLCALMQVNSFKSFLVWMPGLALLFVAQRIARDRWFARRHLVGLTLGFAGGLAASLGLLASAGIAGDYLRQHLAFGNYAGAAERFAIGDRLLHLLGEVPHLAGLALVSLGWCVAVLRRGGWRAEAASLVTAGWLVIELLALHLNPVPFPYNLLHFIPFLFLAAIDGMGLLLGALPGWRRPLLAGFAAATVLAFHLSWTHEGIGRMPARGQRQHVESAEALTSESDPVLDGAGLVISRPPPGRQWMLHSLTKAAYRRGELTTFRELLAQDPAPVLLTNYRWQWLDRGDRRFIGDRYLRLAPRLLVLGGLGESPSGEFTIWRAGRYLIRQIAPGPSPTLDGIPLASEAVRTLAAGHHAWHGSGITWHWLGPRLADPPSAPTTLPNGDLFILD